jgi:hypothetical protein
MTPIQELARLDQLLAESMVQFSNILANNKEAVLQYIAFSREDSAKEMSTILKANTDGGYFRTTDSDDALNFLDSMLIFMGGIVCQQKIVEMEIQNENE